MFIYHYPKTDQFTVVPGWSRCSRTPSTTSSSSTMLHSLYFFIHTLFFFIYISALVSWNIHHKRFAALLVERFGWNPDLIVFFGDLLPLLIPVLLSLSLLLILVGLSLRLRGKFLLLSSCQLYPKILLIERVTSLWILISICSLVG